MKGGTDFDGGYVFFTLKGTNYGKDTKVVVFISDGIHTGTATGTINLTDSGINTYLSLSVTQNGYVNMFGSDAQKVATVS